MPQKKHNLIATKLSFAALCMYYTNKTFFIALCQCMIIITQSSLEKPVRN